MEASRKLQRKGKKSDGKGCAEKRKELQTGRGNVQNTNEQYHAAKSYFLIWRGGIPVIF
jgi:hypothetical protein